MIPNLLAGFFGKEGRGIFQDEFQCLFPAEEKEDAEKEVGVRFKGIVSGASGQVSAVLDILRGAAFEGLRSRRT